MNPIDPMLEAFKPCRLLIVDDLEEIHRDWERIFSDLQPRGTDSLLALERLMFADELVETPSELASEIEFELVRAFQSEEAVEKMRSSMCAKTPISIAFLDIQMPPGANGIDTAIKLREINPTLPVVFCSAYADRSFEDVIQQLGADNVYWVPKPFDIDRLRELAREAARQTQASA